jgi:beta-lactamase class A
VASDYPPVIVQAPARAGVGLRFDYLHRQTLPWWPEDWWQRNYDTLAEELTGFEGTIMTERMLQILLDQRFKGGIPAGLPEAARVAHKTGNISTVHHDAGIVYLEGRQPYVLVILTQFDASPSRSMAVAEVSRDIFECVAGMSGG